MTEHSQTLAGRRPINRRLAIENLKICPLCGAVNALQNGECFVCRWSGRFDHNAVAIEMGLNQLLERCPELRGTFETPPPGPVTAIDRLRSFVARVFKGRRLDVRI